MRFLALLRFHFGNYVARIFDKRAIFVQLCVIFRLNDIVFAVFCARRIVDGNGAINQIG